MPRGKNYVNNNKGVTLQANAKSRSKMQLCEYGPGCTRPDCIYRHEGVAKTAEVCLPFLAGKCTFTDSGCRKRHPKPDEKNRLLEKYKRTRCRFGDECYTEECLYLHPRDNKGGDEPNYIEPSHIAFPPLNGVSTVASVPKPVPNSAWKAAPLVVPPSAHSYPESLPQPVPPTPMDFAPMPPMENQQHDAWHQMQVPMYAPYYAPPPYHPQGHFDPSLYYGGPMPHQAMPYGMNFNAEAKEFVPENSMP